MMMLALGLFIFSLHTAAYQSFQEQNSWKHPSNERVGMRPAYQYTGQGESTITLSGWIAPEVAGTALSLSMLKAMANTGKAYILVSGLGIVHGFYIIDSITEDNTIFFETGKPRRIDFTITLKKVEESFIDDLIGDLALPNLGDFYA